jgi:hypothetical protein
MFVPGFWDGESSWKIRFTPSQEGEWHYQLVVTDAQGVSPFFEGQFQVTASDKHGWLQAGQRVNPEYSARYLAYHDGAPFYGAGYCEALNILIDGFSAENGVGLFNDMIEAGANYIVWWPLYSMSPIKSGYDKFSTSDLLIMDTIVADAQKKGVFLVFTIWDHPELRDKTHSWGDSRWEMNNGFRKLGDIDSFFTSDEAWAWQENFYRYLIARYGYSPAIGLWQTASEINGTNAYTHSDSWIAKVNAYFAENDPYRHPTTASKSGDLDWPEGFAAMDVAQVHVYALDEGPVNAADTIATWTQTMWEHAERPNWIGEFGVKGFDQYPELYHNSIWAALGAGAAMTPAEWNSGGTWGRMTPEMIADLQRLQTFVSEIPLAALDPIQLEITSSDPQVRGWGVAGRDGGLFWIQDFAMEGKPITDVRSYAEIKSGGVAEISGLSAGNYHVLPFDTWQGEFLNGFSVQCADDQPCRIPLPDFRVDIAFKLVSE